MESQCLFEVGFSSFKNEAIKLALALFKILKNCAMSSSAISRCSSR